VVGGSEKRATRRVEVELTDQVDGVAGGEGEDVGAGDGGPASDLDLRLDAVDDLVAAQRVGVGPRVLLPREVSTRHVVVQQDGGVASLQPTARVINTGA
jgi:hypothetical protein